MIPSKLRRFLSQDTALLQANEVQRLPYPETANVDFLRSWLRGLDEGNRFLRGSEQYTWSPPRNSTVREQRYFEKDLVTVHSGVEEQDIFSRVLSSSLLGLWNWFKSQGGSTHDDQRRFRRQVDPDSGLLHYSEQSLLRFNNVLISVIGAAMPIVAIVALYFIDTQGGRIGAMAGFTVAFALVLAVFTNARRLEIAASTAASVSSPMLISGNTADKVSDSLQWRSYLSKAILASPDGDRRWQSMTSRFLQDS